ncbi:MAG: S26 family signal peptidase [Fretibacterium sp.]|nr:S26 family signal peptidase [Fretibacterium sp.]
MKKQKKLRPEQKAAICVLIFGTAAAALLCSGLFVVNTSPSVPVGLWLRRDGPVQRGDIVEIPFEAFRSTDWVPEAYHRKNDWGRVTPYLKRVAGLPGERVEADKDGLLRVAGEVVPNSVPLSMDRVGNVMRAFPLPCQLAFNEVWLLSDSPRGFDSRYLGPAKLDQCSRVIPLLVF